MRKSELLTAILNDYTDGGVPERVAADFCAYATDWLARKGLVGVGHAPGGMSLRFADGSELSLLDSADLPAANQPGISITGNSGGSVRGAAAVADSSFSITGS